ncbi:hypothetical protein NE237_025916 [Protea cynaroides]|uniref:Uncharacterized protein n=1 Tax=Protea cynaroides TaxID=273540 RepID=A0A9Q0K1S6_9MAGN|nr:hypothetical protein NE237_025916 [Protea cynaroides]
MFLSPADDRRFLILVSAKKGIAKDNWETEKGTEISTRWEAGRKVLLQIKALGCRPHPLHCRSEQIMTNRKFLWVFDRNQTKTIIKRARTIQRFFSKINIKT